MISLNVKKIFVVGAVATSTILAGCASPGLGGSNYSRSQVRGEQSVRLGIVETVRDVQIDAPRDGGGTLVGAALGGIGGSTIGGGHNANAAGAIVGAVLGGIVGQAVEKSNGERKGIEVTVRLEGGKLVAITQEKDEEFRVGDRVRILSGQGVTRVSRI